MTPKYHEINLKKYTPTCGMYTLGLIEYHYPMIHIIGVCDDEQNRHVIDYTWLQQRIESALQENKIVFVMLYDEDILAYQRNKFLTNILNSYINDTVYFVTLLDDTALYTKEYDIQCKILELPWLQLNDCLCYDALQIPYNSTATSDYKYISFTGVPHAHRLDLMQNLHNAELSKHGLITVSTTDDYNNLSKPLQQVVKVNERPPYKEPKANGFPDEFPNERGCYMVNDLLVSGNVKNFVQIQKNYSNIPLTIHTETYISRFFSTEKSIWPVLLGKLFLIYGRPGSMAWIQRFYDIDLSKYIDLNFDNDTTDRLKHLLSDNKEFILNADQIHTTLHKNLKKARYSFCENLYNYFISQIDNIYNT